MLVGDIVYNDDFDLNAEYEIYKCKQGEMWNPNSTPVFSTKRDGYSKPLDSVLDLQVQCLTVHNNCLVVVANN